MKTINDKYYVISNTINCCHIVVRGIRGVERQEERKAGGGTT